MEKAWWSEKTVAVVTGANKGIGFEIVRTLAEKGLTVVLTARDKSRGQAALDSLKAKGVTSVVFHQLDTSDSNSVKQLAAWLKTEFGGFDILVNNAGVAIGKYDFDTAKVILNTNYYGMKGVTAELVPLLRPSSAGARIVNVTSRAGLYERLPDGSPKNKFRDEDSFSETMADSLAESYLEDMKAGRAGEKGWLSFADPGRMPMYSESKMFQNVYAAVLAKSFAESRSGEQSIFVAGFCPGTTETDMYEAAKRQGSAGPEGHKTNTVAEGADTGVWLALLPGEEWPTKNGKLFAERSEYPFNLSIPGF